MVAVTSRTRSFCAWRFLFLPHRLPTAAIMYHLQFPPSVPVLEGGGWNCCCAGTPQDTVFGGYAYWTTYGMTSLPFPQESGLLMLVSWRCNSSILMVLYATGTFGTPKAARVAIT